MADKDPKSKNIIVKWNRMRKFGVELEFNARNPNSRDNHARFIEEVLREEGVEHHQAQIREWEHTHDNDGIWVCKPDSSCGFEICTPPLHGPNELKLLGKICQKLKEKNCHYDDTCGLHVHLSLEDFTDTQMQNMLMYWIKIEHNIMHAHPDHRRRNSRYCASAMSRIHTWLANESYSGDELYQLLRRHRGAISPNYWEQRKTIEWRMGEMDLDPDSIKNRVRFLIWFVDICKIVNGPPNLNLYNPKQMLRFLGLLGDDGRPDNKVYSPAVKSMRKWIVDRMAQYIPERYFQKDKVMIIEMKDRLDIDNENQEDLSSILGSEEV